MFEDDGKARIRTTEDDDDNKDNDNNTTMPSTTSPTPCGNQEPKLLRIMKAKSEEGNLRFMLEDGG